MDAGGRAASGTKAEESSGFNKPFPPEAGMTTRGMALRLVADRHKLGSIWRFGPVSWIPAFAGMTEGLRSGICQEWQRGCRDGNLLFPCSSSFRRRPACMDAGGRAASGTKAEESSGLCNTFPPEARMTTQGYDFDRFVADRHKLGSVWRFGCHFLDSDLRRNGGGGGNAN